MFLFVWRQNERMPPEPLCMDSNPTTAPQWWKLLSCSSLTHHPLTTVCSRGSRKHNHSVNIKPLDAQWTLTAFCCVFDRPVFCVGLCFIKVFSVVCQNFVLMWIGACSCLKWGETVWRDIIFCFSFDVKSLASHTCGKWYMGSGWDKQHCCDATVLTTAGENKSVCGHRQSVGGFGTELDAIDRTDESYPPPTRCRGMMGEQVRHASRSRSPQPVCTLSSSQQCARPGPQCERAHNKAAHLMSAISWHRGVSSSRTCFQILLP